MNTKGQPNPNQIALYNSRSQFRCRKWPYGGVCSMPLVAVLCPWQQTAATLADSCNFQLYPAVPVHSWKGQRMGRTGTEGEEWGFLGRDRAERRQGEVGADLRSTFV